MGNPGCPICGYKSNVINKGFNSDKLITYWFCKKCKKDFIMHQECRKCENIPPHHSEPHCVNDHLFSVNHNCCFKSFKGL